jgi:hypothetical protein
MVVYNAVEKADSISVSVYYKEPSAPCTELGASTFVVGAG